MAARDASARQGLQGETDGAGVSWGEGAEGVGWHRFGGAGARRPWRRGEGAAIIVGHMEQKKRNSCNASGATIHARGIDLEWGFFAPVGSRVGQFRAANYRHAARKWHENPNILRLSHYWDVIERSDRTPDDEMPQLGPGGDWRHPL